MSDTPILGHSSVIDPGIAAAWAASRGATPLFCDLAALFWRYAPERGVNPDVAYAQAAKETGFGRFGGVVTPDFHNTCGMKITAGGANGDPNAHQRFPTWDVGIIAHLDHLALYAGAIGYPRTDSPDPRHFTALFGTAPTALSLSGKWAGALYGASLEDDYIAPLYAFSADYEPPAQPVYATRDEVVSLVGTVADALERGDAALTELAAVSQSRHDALSDAIRVHQDADQVRAADFNSRLGRLEVPLAQARALLRSFVGSDA